MITLLTMLAIQNHPRLPLDTIEQAGFTTRVIVDLNRTFDKSAAYHGRRASDGATIEVMVKWGIEENPDGRIKKLAPFPPHGYDGREYPGPSGFKVGTDCFNTFSARGGTWLALTKSEQVSVVMVPPLQYQNGAVEFLTLNWNQEKPLLERIVRHCVARVAGMRLNGLQTRVVAGESVDSGLCERTGRLFGSMRAWAERRGWTIEENIELAYYTLQKGAHRVVVPLGSTEIKIGNEWRDVADAVVMRDGKVYVTASALSLLPGS